MKTWRIGAVVCVATAMLSMAACSREDTKPNFGGADGGPGGPGAPGSVTFTVSGEVLSLGGYPFPPASPDDVAFVDGWEVTFAEVLVTVDALKLSESPDKAPTDQSQSEAIVAEVDGPWAVDLHKGGPITGKGGSDEQAVQIASVANQNRNGGAAFDLTKRYAFGFDLVAASASATSVNLDAQGQADYADMVAKGIVVLYVGTATFKGTNCTPASDPTLNALPRVVHFRFGFKSPTTYVNCQNPDNDPAKGLGDEEHQRGIALKSNAATVAQVTVHTDHPFWESVAHDSPAHFDQLAALATVGSGDSGLDAGGAVAMLTIDDLRGVDFTGFKTKVGARSLKWRSCVDASRYTLPTTPTMGFDARSVPINPTAAPSSALRDYYDYFTYNQSTQGHLNSDGLCYVKRNYPSPP
jgi:hypothetical protein